MSTTPKLIDYKLLNEDIKIKILSEQLKKGLQKLHGVKPSTLPSLAPSPSKSYLPKPRFYKKTSILFNLILGSVIIFVPFFLYYRYKHKPSKIERINKYWM